MISCRCCSAERERDDRRSVYVVASWELWPTRSCIHASRGTFLLRSALV